ncbi:MAG: aspartate-semialdehyde dehydrogenase [Chloroflexi bacterium]|nr:aspartate-semialdehyde dehydrogenase [Chloroflexota bacterium]
MRPYHIAIVGATGIVGDRFIRVLEQRNFPIASVRMLASKRSVGRTLPFAGKQVPVEETTPDSFKGVDIVFLSATTEASRVFAPLAAEAGALVIDDSSAWRMDPQVPLVVPEVNPEDVAWHRGIISTPNCSTVPLVMVLQALRGAAQVRRVVVDTYQSVSGTGGAAVRELDEQTRLLLGGETPQPVVYPHPIAFNLLPHIDSFLENGYTKEEWKMVQETRKILHDDALPVSATCVRVPVMVSHSEAVHVELDRPMSTEEARRLLAVFPGMVVQDDPATNGYPMPAAAAGRDEVFVGRIRQDASHPNGLALWVVSDNLLKGAALNAVQIAEVAVREGKV